MYETEKNRMLDGGRLGKDKKALSPEQTFGLEGENKLKGGPINPKVKGLAATKYANTQPVPDGTSADRYKVYGKKHHG